MLRDLMGLLNPPLRLVSLGVLLGSIALGVPGRAQDQTESPGATVSVRNVKFSAVRAPGGQDPWLEAVVELDVAPGNGSGIYNRYADRVQVTLGVSIATRINDYDFYRASAEAVSLEAGRATVRFYLPPEIVKREQATGTPFAWLVELAVQGRPLALAASNASGNLRAADAVRSFKDHVAQAAPANDGVLVPQYDSPFADRYPADTPSFVRRAR
jgi:hypothetical protein